MAAACICWQLGVSCPLKTWTVLHIQLLPVRHTSIAERLQTGPWAWRWAQCFQWASNTQAWEVSWARGLTMGFELVGHWAEGGLWASGLLLCSVGCCPAKLASQHPPLQTAHQQLGFWEGQGLSQTFQQKRASHVSLPCGYRESCGRELQRPCMFQACTCHDGYMCADHHAPSRKLQQSLTECSGHSSCDQQYRTDVAYAMPWKRGLPLQQ